MLALTFLRLGCGKLWGWSHGKMATYRLGVPPRRLLFFLFVFFVLFGPVVVVSAVPNGRSNIEGATGETAFRRRPRRDLRSNKQKKSGKRDKEKEQTREGAWRAQKLCSSILLGRV